MGSLPVLFYGWPPLLVNGTLPPHLETEETVLLPSFSLCSNLTKSTLRIIFKPICSSINYHYANPGLHPFWFGPLSNLLSGLSGLSFLKCVLNTVVHDLPETQDILALTSN